MCSVNNNNTHRRRLCTLLGVVKTFVIRITFAHRVTIIVQNYILKVCTFTLKFIQNNIMRMRTIKCVQATINMSRGI